MTLIAYYWRVSTAIFIVFLTFSCDSDTSSHLDSETSQGARTEQLSQEAQAVGSCVGEETYIERPRINLFS